MLAIVNPSAGGGQAEARWSRVLPLLRARRADLRVMVGDGDLAMVRGVIRRALRAGETEYVAAGGDGTVNLVASALADLAPERLDALALGAIGLGSSNDFHKPADPRAAIAGRPARLDFARAAPRDVCVVAYRDERGATGRMFFVVNASIGITAEANWRFNHPDPWLGFLKRASTDTAITWAALHTLVRCPPLAATLALDDGAPEPVRLTNLGVVKCPNFAGGLRYDSAFEPDSGCLDVHLVRAMSVPRLLGVFAALSRGRFAGLEGTASWRARRVTVRADRPFAIEGDGEVVRAVAAEFHVLPHRLRVCP